MKTLKTLFAVLFLSIVFVLPANADGQIDWPKEPPPTTPTADMETYDPTSDIVAILLSMLSL